MPQSRGQNFKVQGRSINLTLRIELVGNVDESGEELASVSEANVDGIGPPTLNEEAPQVNDDEKHEEDSITNLKRRLQLAEMECSRLESLHQKYRLRWLEENHRARVLKKYAPDEISTCSPHQIVWNAPSPAPTEYETEVDSDQE
ncbi:hypothetical protein DEU56DRAFT_916620 [Suillus clintonianus]|uniref:uncharacterized protein n=1 Tax=Suillus clintonianus TaxID=1904413 RepID=UPI001B871F91|nr:uncharacterized protein DEU56DRAFT_916620 [Suillus clintonianus]KAG2125334.1 hypothetical protein DEU56DRAFT_916620 [Suillus clintonianus]